MNTVTAVLFIAGIVVLAVGIGILASRKGSTQGFTRTSAVVDSVMLGEGPGTVKPIVTFQVNGETVRQSTGEVGSQSFTAKPGDTVQIAYRRTGAAMWDIMLDQGDADEMLAWRKNAMTAIGWLFSGLGAVIIIVAVALLRR